MNERANTTARGAISSPIVELRQYTLHPGRREQLIETFDGHLIEGQEDAGMTVIGQFRDIDDAEKFVWLRGFDTMEARKASLGAFYG
nr:NIPSNAP family protein [Pseudaminobacter sp.]